MTRDQQTWSVLALLTAIVLLFLWLSKKRSTPAPQTTTQTSVTLQGQTTNVPTRTDNNEIQLRVCTYDSGAQLTLNPLAVNGQACPPVFADLTGKTGNLVKDEVITIPTAGQNSFASNPPAPQATATPGTDTNPAI